MLQGIETVNNYANINSNKTSDAARIVGNPNSDGITAASRDTVAQKIKKIERSEKAAEATNQKKDSLLEFLERKVGRGEILSHDENLYVMGKKASLYEQSMNMQKLRDKIMQRLEHKRDDESLEQIYKELTEELKSEYGISNSENAAATQTVSDAETTTNSSKSAEEYIRMSNALQIGFSDYIAVIDSSSESTENTESTEAEETEVQLLGSSSDDTVKTDFEKEIEARQDAEADAIVNAREKLNQRMFSKINTTV